MTRKVAFPVLGELSLLAEKYLRTLGVDVITPPPTTRRTLDIGVQNTPEGLCIPCKLLFGNYLEAAELGATDIIMLGGPNTCRLGYTVSQHAEQLSKKGYYIRPCPFDLSRIGPEIIRLTREFVPLKPVQELVGTLRYIMDMFNLVDEARQVTFYIRPRELERDLLIEPIHLHCSPFLSWKTISSFRSSVRRSWSESGISNMILTGGYCGSGWWGIFTPS